MDLAYATASEVVTAVARRDVSSREVLEHLLQRIDTVNPPLNAVVVLDADRALERAHAADEATARGERWGPLHGLPMTVKDVWETAGLVTTSGAPALADHVPTDDAVAVARLKGAGAVVFGKTNTPLYAGDDQTFNEVYGRTNNPWDLARTPGGSSGGAAAALAAGLTPLELGSDIGGSIRAPSHFCGTYGLKPSWGVVPSRGHIPGPPGSLVETDVNCNGPMARALADLVLAFDVLAGPLDEEAVGWRLDLPTGPPVGDVAGLRVAVVTEDPAVPVAGEVAAVVRAYADRLADAGAHVESTALPVPLADGFRSWIDLVVPIIGAGLPYAEYAAFRAFEGVDGDDPATASARALTSRTRDWLQAHDRRQHQRRRWAEHFRDHDVLLAPVMPVAAFPHDTEVDFPLRTLDVDGTTIGHLELTAWCGAIGAVRLPVVALPAGRTPAGLPVGVQVVGPYLHDRRLLDLAAALDDAAGDGFVRPPGA